MAARRERGATTGDTAGTRRFSPMRATSCSCRIRAGSTGYGQKFVNDVSGDWGGRAFIDIMNGVAEVDQTSLRRQNADRRGRSQLRRLHGRLASRAQQRSAIQVQGVCFARRRLQSGKHGRQRPRSFGSSNWEFKGMPWENPRLLSDNGRRTNSSKISIRRRSFLPAKSIFASRSIKACSSLRRCN